MRIHRDIKLVTTDKRRRKLVSEPKYHTTKYFSEKPLVIKMNKVNVKTNKSVYLGLVIQGLSKIVMYGLCHDYVKPKYGKANLCYMVTDSF